MRLRYLILFAVIILLVGLNIAGQGITRVVGEGPWQITTLKWRDDYIVFGLFGRELTMPQFITIWLERLREIVDLYIK